MQTRLLLIFFFLQGFTVYDLSDNRVSEISDPGKANPNYCAKFGNPEKSIL